jgi:hypothetical protein
VQSTYFRAPDLIARMKFRTAWMMMSVNARRNSLTCAPSHPTRYSDEPRIVALEVAHSGTDTGFVLLIVFERGPIVQAKARYAEGVLHEQRLKIDLVDPMRRFRGWPPCVRAALCAEPLLPLGIERAPGKFSGWASWNRPGEAVKLWT